MDSAAVIIPQPVFERDYSDLLSSDQLAIFLFHGVIADSRESVRNYTRKHLDAKCFASVIRLLRDAGEPVGVEHAVAMLAGQERLRPRSFVISFDDGFRNNLTVAAPILEQLEVPAVFYVTTGFIGDDRPSWIDLIADALLRTQRSGLDLPWSEQPRSLDTNADRIRVLEEIRNVLKTSRDFDPYDVAEQIRLAARVGEFVPDEELDAKLSWEELRALAQRDLFEVGGHSHTHRILSFLREEELEEEIATSMGLLERELGQPVRHYSYPEGLEHCYSDGVISVLRRHGIIAAPTAEAGINPVGCDPFRLRRIMVPRPPGSRRLSMSEQLT